MKKNFKLILFGIIVLQFLVSCSSKKNKFLGYWTRIGNSEQSILITDNGDNFIVEPDFGESSQGKKYPGIYSAADKKIGVSSGGHQLDIVYLEKNDHLLLSTEGAEFERSFSSQFDNSISMKDIAGTWEAKFNPVVLQFHFDENGNCIYYEYFNSDRTIFSCGLAKYNLNNGMITYEDVKELYKSPSVSNYCLCKIQFYLFKINNVESISGNVFYTDKCNRFDSKLSLARLNKDIPDIDKLTENLTTKTEQEKWAIVGKWKFTGMQSTQMDRMVNETDAKCKILDNSIAACGNDKTKAAPLIQQKEGAMASLKMMKESLDKMKQNSYMEFMKNGKYTSSMGGQNDNGTWSVDSEGKNLTTTSLRGKSDVLIIDEISSEKLVLMSTPTSTDITKIIFVSMK